MNPAPRFWEAQPGRVPGPELGNSHAGPTGERCLSRAR